MSESFTEEEPWEAEISALLGGLPPVEPPPGFLAGAVDHRPMFAGRTVLGMGAVAVGVFLAAVGLGALQRDQIVPELDTLAARHTSAAAGVTDPDYREVDDASGPSVSLPGGFQEEGAFEADELIQSLYTSDDDLVSIFSQPGRVDWDKLPSDGLETLGGSKAWVDTDTGVLVFEADDSAVTVIGLSGADLSTFLNGLPGTNGGFLQGLRDAAGVLSAELGFPALD